MNTNDNSYFKVFLVYILIFILSLMTFVFVVGVSSADDSDIETVEDVSMREEASILMMSLFLYSQEVDCFISYHRVKEIKYSLSVDSIKYNQTLKLLSQ